MSESAGELFVREVAGMWSATKVYLIWKGYIDNGADWFEMIEAGREVFPKLENNFDNDTPNVGAIRRWWDEISKPQGEPICFGE